MPNYNYTNFGTIAEGSFKNRTGDMSFGMMEWKNNDIKTLFQNIQNKDEAAFKAVLDKHNAADFLDKLNNAAARWIGWKLGETCDWAMAIRDFMSTSYSHEAQMAMLEELTNKAYDEFVSKKNIIDIGVTLFLNDACTISKSAFDVIVSKASDLTNCTLDDIKKVANTYVSTLKDRWDNSYLYIMTLLHEGKLKEENGHLVLNIPSVTNMDGMFGLNGDYIEPISYTWPIPGFTNISKGFSTGHEWIDVTQDGIAGAKVISPFDGKVTFNNRDANLGNYALIEASRSGSNNAIVKIALQEYNSKITYPRGAGAPRYNLPGEPWCAAFATWCAVKAGAMGSQIMGVQNCEAEFKSKGLFRDKNYTPSPGDLLTMRYTKNGKQGNHIGVVEYVKGDEIGVIDGNSSSPGSGGSIRCIAKTVFSKSRGTSSSGFYRTVGYCLTGSGGGSNSVITVRICHMNKMAGEPLQEKQVKQGDYLGTVGMSGNCMGYMASIEFRENHTLVDPTSYLRS